MSPEHSISRRSVIRATTGTLVGVGTIGVGSALAGGRVEVNVGFSAESGLRAARSAATEVVREFAFDALTIRAPTEAVSGLAERADVRYVEENGVAHAQSWGYDRIDADVVNANGYDGAGADVAVLDTGIDSDHPCLPNVGQGKAFVECKGKGCNYSWDDDNGHGTQVAGIIGASESCDCTTGVAPEATLHSVKVLDSNGAGSYSDIASGIQYTADQGWDVGNLSLGSSSGSSILKDSVQYAYDKGVALVGSAGGDGPCSSCVNYPAAYSEVIAVSATNKDDVLADFSSEGPEIELCAPGTNIRTTDVGGGCTTISGTSMATAFVSGSIAVLMAQGYTNADARDQLGSSAEDLGLPSDEQGSGLVDPAAALGLDSSDN